MSNPLRKFLGLERRAVHPNDIWMAGLDTMHLTRTKAGKNVNRDTALQVSAVWAAVRVLSDGVSTLPVNSHIRNKGVRMPYKRPDWMLFDQGPYSKIDIVGQMMMSLLLEGNAYVATYRGNDGAVLFLEVLNPDAVEPVQNAKTREISWKITSENGTNEVGPYDLLHIRGMTMPGEVKGLSPIAHLRETIGLSMAATEFGSAFFGNNALPGLVVESDSTISETGVNAMKNAWNEIHQGSGNSHRLAVLTEGAKINKLSVAPNDAQFLETRGFQVNDIARIYGVPVNLLQHSDGPEMGQSLSDKNTHFVQHTLRPWVERIEAGFSWLLWSEGNPRQSFIKFNMDALLRGDYTQRYETYSKAVTQGILLINEVRAFEDMPPVPWGDEPISVQVQAQEELDIDPATQEEEQ